MKKCERCRKTAEEATGNPFALLDFCAVCSKDLCPTCMAKGCCGNKPAKSGNEEEFSDDE